MRSPWRTAVPALAVALVAGSALSGPASAAVAVGVSPTVIINEVSTTNFSGARDEDSKRGDWIELFNTTGATVDLTGWGLSNATKNPFRWVFPTGTTISAKGYLRVWADKADRTASRSNLHTNFNIDNGVDSAVLSAPNSTVLGQLVDIATPPRLTPDASWCRLPNGVAGAAFSTCLAPTPGAANSGATAGALLATPTLSVPSGVYPSARTVGVSGPAGAELRYTTDGSAPVATSPLVTGPLTVSTSSTLRVGAFQAGALPSYAASATYVIDPTGKFAGQRLLFVGMRPSDRSSYAAGGSAPAQGWQSVVELIAPNGQSAFVGDASTEQAGQIGSRNGQDTKPMDIKFTDALGVKDVSYPIFSAKPTVTKFKKLRLRNAGDDYQEAHLRDQFWQSVGTEANLAPSASEPVQVFLNGAYYGMMDLREKEDETLIESSYGVDKDGVEYLSDSRVVNGDNASASFDAVYSFINGNDMAVPANFARAASLLDVEAFAQDFAIHMFAADGDWQWRNMHYFRAPDYDGKWRYRLHDIDISSNGTNAWGFDTRPTYNMNTKYTGHRSGNIMRALLKNPEFKNLYANVIADQLNSVVSSAELSTRLDTFAGAMAPYLPNQIALNADPSSMAKWNTEIAKLRSWATERTPNYLTHTRSYLGVTALNRLSVQTSDPAMGTVKVNTLDLSTRLTSAAPASWSGTYWANVPVTLEARPKPGFVFTGWQGDLTGSARVVSVSAATANRTYRATFAPVAAPAVPVVEAVAAQAVTTGKVVSLAIDAEDPNGYSLEFKDKDLPSGLSIHKKTGLIYGKPTKAGTFASTITATNGVTSTKISITWTVTNQLDRIVTLPVGVTGDGAGLTGTYFANTAFTGTPGLTRVEAPAVEVGAGSGPVAGFGSSNWAIRWTGNLTAPLTGTYSLRSVIRSDDGVRVWVGGRLVYDAWTSRATTPTATVDLVANTPTPIVVEFQDRSSSASLSMQWQIPGQTAFSPMVRGVFTP